MGQHPVTEVTLDVFPDRVPSRFTYYDDDGTTYAYERGVFYRQSVRASDNGTSADLQLGEPDGSFKPPLQFYIVKVHGRSASAVLLDGKALARLPAEDQLMKSGEAGWTTGRDRFGPVTLLRIPAQHDADLTFR